MHPDRSLDPNCMRFDPSDHTQHRRKRAGAGRDHAAGVGARSRATRAVVTGIAALTVTLATAAAQASPTSLPSPGPWRIVAYQVVKPPLNEFTGSFSVTRRDQVSGFDGMTGHAVNRGCPVGERITVLGSFRIGRLVVPNSASDPGGSDFYEVGYGRTPFLQVRLRLQRRGAKTARLVHGEFRLYFPGGISGGVRLTYGFGSLDYFASPSSARSSSRFRAPPDSCGAFGIR